MGYAPAMATDAQIEANRNNAAASTGPQTPEGKSISSRNAVSHGLFSITDPAQDPDAANEFNALAAALHHDLAPEGVLEQTLAGEIARAAWRLRRCARVEDNLTDTDPFTDPMTNAATAPTQKAVDRARLETHRILKRSMDELRRLQNERRFRFEILAEGVDDGNLGLASYKNLIPVMVAEKRFQLMKRKLEGLGSFESMLGIVTAPPLETAPTERTQSAPAAVQTTPRNGPCPCGSGQKYKRCCGKDAAPVLHVASLHTRAA
jgi:hypothetical protein